MIPNKRGHPFSKKFPPGRYSVRDSGVGYIGQNKENYCIKSSFTCTFSEVRTWPKSTFRTFLASNPSWRVPYLQSTYVSKVHSRYVNTPLPSFHHPQLVGRLNDRLLRIISGCACMSKQSAEHVKIKHF